MEFGIFSQMHCPEWDDEHSRYHREIDVAKVQIWCAFAEVLLGEASFDKPVM